MAVRVEAGGAGGAAWMAGPATPALRGAMTSAGVPAPADLLVADGAGAPEAAAAWMAAARPSRILVRGLRWELEESGPAGTAGGAKSVRRFAPDLVRGVRFDLARGGRPSADVRALTR